MESDQDPLSDLKARALRLAGEFLASTNRSDGSPVRAGKCGIPVQAPRVGCCAATLLSVCRGGGLARAARAPNTGQLDRRIECSHVDGVQPDVARWLAEEHV